MEGKLVEVLVDGEGKRKDQIVGRIPQNKIVNFNSNIKLIGRLVIVKINRGLLNSLRGEIPGDTV